MRSKALVSWSSGKDSAFALGLAREDLDVVGLVTTVTTAYGRVSMHGVREALLDRQLDALGLPCRKVGIPTPCTNEIYEAAFTAALRDAQTTGVTHVVFGDLFLEDVRAYRERLLAPLGLIPVFPLWKRATKALADAMIASGLRATVTCLDPRQMPRSFAGRSFDAAFLRDLPSGVDPCGEKGEFHTFVTDGPMFRAPIATTSGDIVEREGFVFADLVPA